MDDRIEQALGSDHRDDREKDHQQSRKRQRLLESLADRPFIDNTAETGRKHNHTEADKPDRGQRKHQSEDQPEGYQPLYDQGRVFTLRAFLIAVGVVLDQDLENLIG